MPRWAIITGRIAWVIPALVGFGLLTWVSFAYPAIRMRNGAFLAIALIFLGIAIAEILSIQTHGDGEVFVILWIVGILVYVIGLKWWLPWHLPDQASRGASD